MQWLIEVSYKPGFFDALGHTIKKDVKDLGISGIKDVKSAQMYHIEDEISEPELKLLCEELLVDKITQQYKISTSCIVHRASTPYKTNDERRTTNSLPANLAGRDERTFIVQVWYKKGVTDAVADTVKKGAVDLGIHGISTVKTGYEYTIIGNISRQQIEKICKGLLANKVVQDYNIITTKTRNLENTKFFRRADL